MSKEAAIVITDGSAESAALVAVAGQSHRITLLDASGDDAARHEAVRHQAEFADAEVEPAVMPLHDNEDPGDLFWAASAVPQAAMLARQRGASRIFVPLRIGLESRHIEQAAECVQLLEELVRHGLGVAGAEVHAPLLEMEPWQVVDLAVQLEAPLTEAHGSERHEAFVRAGRDVPAK
jgi:hypothetical protein